MNNWKWKKLPNHLCDYHVIPRVWITYINSDLQSGCYDKLKFIFITSKWRDILLPFHPFQPHFNKTLLGACLHVDEALGKGLFL